MKIAKEGKEVVDVEGLDSADAALEGLKPVPNIMSLKRERQFLRSWAAAKEAGELNLPEDSLLVIPELFDGVATFGGDDTSSQREEDR